MARAEDHPLRGSGGHGPTFLVRRAVLEMAPFLAVIEMEVQKRPWSLGAIEAEFRSASSMIWSLHPGDLFAPPAGFMAFRLLPDEIYLMEFSVARRHQGKGGGSLMLRLLQRFALKKGVRRIALDVDLGNRRACHFYQAHGFVFADEGLAATMDVSPDHTGTVVMVWPSGQGRADGYGP